MNSRSSAAVALSRPWRALAADYSELVKARLTTLVLLTTAVGFYMGLRDAVSGWLCFHTLFGTALVAAGAAALNQWLERDWDALMPRTRERPIPAGRIAPEEAWIVGFSLSIAGLAILALGTNLASAALAGTTLLIYIAVYTPLKRVSSLNTLVGAVPGAIPPLIGWVAVRGSVDLDGWLLFALVFFWQIPHFLAIAWLYRDDYEQAGFRMLPSFDPTGAITARQSLIYWLGLLVVSLAPSCTGLAGPWYFVAALALGLGFGWGAWQFACDRSRARARNLFLWSIAYLPLLLAALVMDKTA